MQTKRESVIEALLNVGSGYVIGVLLQVIIYPFYDLNVSIWDNIQLAGIFTIVSIVRSYVWRRYWNHRLMTKLKGKHDHKPKLH